VVFLWRHVETVTMPQISRSHPMNIRHILFVAALFCPAAFAAPASRPPVAGSWQLRYA